MGNNEKLADKDKENEIVGNDEKLIEKDKDNGIKKTDEKLIEKDKENEQPKKEPTNEIKLKLKPLNLEKLLTETQNQIKEDIKNLEENTLNYDPNDRTDLTNSYMAK